MFKDVWEKQWMKPIKIEEEKKIEFGPKINKNVTDGLYLHRLELNVKKEDIRDHDHYEIIIKDPDEFKMQPQPPFKIEQSNIKGINLWAVYARYNPKTKYKHLKDYMNFEKKFKDFSDAIQYFLSVSNTFHQDLQSVYETFHKLWEVRDWHPVLTDKAIKLHEKKTDGTPRESKPK